MTSSQRREYTITLVVAGTFLALGAWLMYWAIDSGAAYWFS